MNKKLLIVALLLLGSVASKMDAFFGRPWGWRGYYGYPGWRWGGYYPYWRRPYWGGYPYWRRPYYVQNTMQSQQQLAEQKKIVT